MSAEPRPEPDAFPRELIITIYGLYARTEDNWLSVAALVRLMTDLGADESAVRASVYRLKQRGVLTSRKIETVAGYELSPGAVQTFAEGDARIFSRRRATLADNWLMLVFSVPETERGRRHELRTELQRLNFGTAAPGVWVAPGNLRSEAERVLLRRGLSKYVDIFTGQHVAFAELNDKVRTWWDFSELTASHDAFLSAHRSVLTRWSQRSGSDADAFNDYIRTLTTWRRIPDPRLPTEVLPYRWSGLSSEILFENLTNLLRVPAERHARAVIHRWGVTDLPRQVGSP